MFGSLWKSSSQEEEDLLRQHAKQLQRLLACFPIGEKITYYPEYLEDLNLETIILGYLVNDQPVYARDHVRDVDGAVSFFIESTGETLVAGDLASFAVIVPDTSELEKTLDYDSKAELGRAGQFVRGNSITLVSPAKEEGTPVVDTTVVRRTIVKEGYYQNYKVVVLEPQLDTLENKEHRQQARLELSLDCTLAVPADTEAVAATLVDYSELCVGIVLPEASLEAAAPAKGMQVVLCIAMPLLDKSFELAGKVSAVRTGGSLVVELHGSYKGSKVADLQLVDRLDLRASLVQCSREQQSQAGLEEPVYNSLR